MKRLPVIAFSALMALVSSLRAAPLDDRIPKDALVYAGWRGSDALTPEYAESNLKGILDTSGLRAYIQQQMPHWMELAADKDPTAPEQINDLLAGADIIWRHPVAFYVGPFDFPAGGNGEPKPRIALLCDAGPDAPALLALLQKAQSKIPPNPDANLTVAQDGNVIVITVGVATVGDFAVHPDALKSLPAYQKAISNISPNAALTAYIDPPGFIGMMDSAFAAQPNIPPEIRQKYDTVLKVLGIRNLGQIVYGGGFDKKAWTEDAFIATTGPRTGLLSLLDAGPIDDASFAAIPNEAVAFTVARFDPMKLLTTARQIAGDIDPQALGFLNNAIDSAGHELGLDLEKDFLATLGDHWISYRAPSPDGVGLVQSFVMKVKDGGTLTNSLKTLAAQATEKGGGRVNIDQAEIDGIAVTQLHLPMLTIAWTVRNDYLYVSTAGGISAAVAQVEKKQPSILTNPTYLAARALLPKVPASAFNFSDPSKIYPELYRSASMLLPFLSAAGINVPVQILPNPAKSAPFLTPGASESWTDDQGVHFKSVTAIPGGGLLGGNLSPETVAIAGVGAAVALPAMGQSRELAQRAASASNLHGILRACLVWAADHNDLLPDNFSQLIVANYCSPKQFISPGSGTKALNATQETLDNAKTDPDAFSKSLDEHCDYVYLGQGIDAKQCGVTFVLAYEKPAANTHDGINLGFGDGHVEFVKRDDLTDAFKSTNDLLRKCNKSEVDVDALLKAIPENP